MARDEVNSQFQRKNVNSHHKLEDQMEKLVQRKAREGRSTILAADLWIKTYQNAPNFQIGPKYELGYFWWKFSNLGKKIFVDG